MTRHDSLSATSASSPAPDSKSSCTTRWRIFTSPRLSSTSHAWKQATADNPAGICGPIGPTEQLPLVARLINDLGISIKDGHFWGMDEWYDPETKKEVSMEHPLSFEKADRELCFNRIQKKLVMPDTQLHFPKADVSAYVKSWQSGVRCVVMQGGQGRHQALGLQRPPQTRRQMEKTSRRRPPNTAS